MRRQLACLYGPNGSGKSSSINYVTALMQQKGIESPIYLCSDDLARQKLLANPELPRPQAELEAWKIVNRLKYEFLKDGKSFIIESVFSHPSHLDFLRAARDLGYNIIVIYIATDSSDINVRRVQKRVSQGGQPVPEEKIRNRYERSLRLLKEALPLVNEAYVFDNSVDDGLATLCAVYNKDGGIQILDRQHTWVLECLK